MMTMLMSGCEKHDESGSGDHDGGGSHVSETVVDDGLGCHDCDLCHLYGIA